MFALLRLAHAGVFRLGLGVELWAPGGDSPGIVFEALSPTATLYSQLNLSSVTLALRVGYLHDRSARTVPDGRTYTPGDQVSLGVTAADAVLVGLGITGRAGPVDLYADLSLDALVRRDGLSFAASRAAATLGAMLTVAARYHLGMEASVHLGSYPRIQAAARPTAWSLASRSAWCWPPTSGRCGPPVMQTTKRPKTKRTRRRRQPPKLRPAARCVGGWPRSRVRRCQPA
jgi:hypothetical protein